MFFCDLVKQKNLRNSMVVLCNTNSLSSSFIEMISHFSFFKCRHFERDTWARSTQSSNIIFFYSLWSKKTKQKYYSTTKTEIYKFIFILLCCISVFHVCHFKEESEMLRTKRSNRIDWRVPQSDIKKEHSMRRIIFNNILSI